MFFIEKLDIIEGYLSRKFFLSQSISILALVSLVHLVFLRDLEKSHDIYFASEIFV